MDQSPYLVAFCQAAGRMRDGHPTIRQVGGGGNQEAGDETLAWDGAMGVYLERVGGTSVAHRLGALVAAGGKRGRAGVGWAGPDEHRGEFPEALKGTRTLL